MIGPLGRRPKRHGCTRSKLSASNEARPSYAIDSGKNGAVPCGRVAAASTGSLCAESGPGNDTGRDGASPHSPFLSA